MQIYEDLKYDDLDSFVYFNATQYLSKNDINFGYDEEARELYLLLNNNKIIYEDFDFDEKSGGVFLNKKACEKFVEQFEKRLRQEVSYISEVSYKMSFRRIIEYQVMLLIKALESNNADIYKPVLIK